MDQLDGRVAVVTGGGSGIGLGMAGAFAREGMHVVLADIDEARLRAARGAVADAGAASVLTVPTDVADESAVRALVQRAVDELGTVHVLCNNAGVSTLGYQWETPMDDWRWLLGVVHGIHAVMPVLLTHGEGHIVNTASMGGLITMAGSAPYGASKHAVVGLSKALRLELAIKAPGIGVSVVCPGQVATNIADGIRTKGTPKDHARLDALRASNAAGMDPAEVGTMVVAAIRNRTFWVLPNGDDHLDVLQREVDEVLHP
jgi:NADP-dependent 3-hydroxy acid dehydrogenase YdfG